MDGEVAVERWRQCVYQHRRRTPQIDCIKLLTSLKKCLRGGAPIGTPPCDDFCKRFKWDMAKSDGGSFPSVRPRSKSQLPPLDIGP